MKHRTKLVLSLLACLVGALLWRGDSRDTNPRREALLPSVPEALESDEPARYLAPSRAGAVQEPSALRTEEQAETGRSAAPTRTTFLLKGSVSTWIGQPVRSCTLSIRKEPTAAGRRGFSQDFMLGDKRGLQSPAAFELRLPGPGRYQLWARPHSPGANSQLAISSQVATVVLNESNPSTGVELMLGQPLDLAGRVETVKGQPIAGAVVRAFLDPRTEREDELRLFSDVERFSDAATRSSKRGTFKFLAMHPETPPLQLRVELRPEHLALILGEAPPGRGGPLKTYVHGEVVVGTTDLVVRVDPERLRGVGVTVEAIYGTEDTPAALSFLLVKVDERGRTLERWNGGRTLDDEQRFTLEGLEPNARYELTLIDGMYNSSEVFGPFRATRGGTVARFSMRASRALKLTAVAPDGRPRKDARFSIQRYVEPTPADDKGGLRRKAPPVQRCRGGRARVGAGTYVVSAEFKQLSASRVVEVGTQDLELVLELARTPRGAPR